jgi:hypothetical protein
MNNVIEGYSNFINIITILWYRTSHTSPSVVVAIVLINKS